MITVEDCHRKSAQWLGEAQSASDPEISASMRRVSDAWITLGQHIERDTFRRSGSPAPMRRPADLAKPRNIYDVDIVQAGDVLRSRLHLSDKAPDDISQ
jgi:hypothetical protein